MSKTSETKQKILKILESGPKRLVDIYPALGLSAATVSQHMKELREMNLIKETEDRHFKNMKYYILNEKNDYAANARKLMGSHLLKTGLGVILVAVLVSSIALLSHNSFSTGNSIQSSTLNISLTDPPHVPLGTERLNITYSSIKIHVTKSSINSSWITVNTTGTIDLMSLINVSKLIGSAKVPFNSVINAASFNISKASITINNVTYPVSLLENQVTANISSSRLNGTSELLLDLSPTILTIYTSNSTLFEMVPSLTAVVVARGDYGVKLNHSGVAIPQQYAPNKNLVERLNSMNGAIVISDAGITQTGNITSISISVKDNSSKRVELDSILIFGNESMYVNVNSIRRYPVPVSSVSPAPFHVVPFGISAALAFPAVPSGAQTMQQVAISRHLKNSMANLNSIGQFNKGTINVQYLHNESFYDFNATNSSYWQTAYNWSTGAINRSWQVVAVNRSKFAQNMQNVQSVQSNQNGQQWVSINPYFNIPRQIGLNGSPKQISVGMKNAYAIGSAKESLGVITLLVNENGSLSQPSFSMRSNFSQQGFILNPGQTATLDFNGTISLGANLVIVHFINGSSYNINVISNGGASASYAATAK